MITAGRWFRKTIFKLLKTVIMTIQQRLKAPTPKFFKRVRNIGLVLAAVGGSLLTAPIALPVVIVKLAGYLAVAGGVATAISQATTEEPNPQKQESDGQQYPF
jgi:ABC-type xylose transport system permease subunit